MTNDSAKPKSDLWAKLRLLHPLAPITFEAILYGHATRDIKGYAGGAWRTRGKNLVVMKQGLETPPTELSCPTNGYEGSTTLITATAAVCVCAINHVMWQLHEKKIITDAAAEAMGSLFYAARDQALNDPDIDSSVFLGYID